MNGIYVFLLLATLHTVTYGQWITEKIVEGVIDRDDDYWVIKTNGSFNKPTFSTFIRFYNTHTAKSEHQIDCFKSALILYLPKEIIFRTTGHFWSEGDSYFVTLDEGVLSSDNIRNSTSYNDPKFWEFNVVRPRYS